jgi:hypothetical protein
LNVKIERKSKQRCANSSLNGSVLKQAEVVTNASGPARLPRSPATVDTPDNNSSGVRSKTTRRPWAKVGESSVPGLEIFRAAIDPVHQHMLVQRINAEARWQPDFSRLRWWVGHE